MGNHTSCIKPQSSNSKNAKLVDSQGQVRLVELHTTVAEIMLDNPGFALAPVDELMRAHRIPVMKADDMLFARKVYLLVPVDKVNSKLSDLQLAAVNSVVFKKNDKKLWKRTRGGSKVSPISESGECNHSIEDVVKALGEKCTGLAGQRRRYNQAWEPVLEPIFEA